LFVARLLLIFLVLPLVLVLSSHALSTGGRLWLLFVLWPMGLVLFAVIQFLRDRQRAVPDEGGPDLDREGDIAPTRRIP
jgi:hypothetical protein